MTQTKKPAVKPKPAAKPAKPASAKTDKKASEEKAPEAEAPEDPEVKAAEVPASEESAVKAAEAPEVKADEVTATEENAVKAADETANNLQESIDHLKEVGNAIQKASAMVKRAAEVFEMYPELQECFFTSDGTAFTQSQHAVMHGQSLEVNQIITIKKSEV